MTRSNEKRALIYTTHQVSYLQIDVVGEAVQMLLPSPSCAPVRDVFVVLLSGAEQG